MARRLGNLVGTFEEVDCTRENFCSGESLRVCIRIDILKALEGGSSWILMGQWEAAGDRWNMNAYWNFAHIVGRLGIILNIVRNFSRWEKSKKLKKSMDLGSVIKQSQRKYSNLWRKVIRIPLASRKMLGRTSESRLLMRQLATMGRSDLILKGNFDWS